MANVNAAAAEALHSALIGGQVTSAISAGFSTTIKQAFQGIGAEISTALAQSLSDPKVTQVLTSAMSKLFKNSFGGVSKVVGSALGSSVANSGKGAKPKSNKKLSTKPNVFQKFLTDPVKTLKNVKKQFQDAFLSFIEFFSQIVEKIEEFISSILSLVDIIGSVPDRLATSLQAFTDGLKRFQETSKTAFDSIPVQIESIITNFDIFLSKLDGLKDKFAPVGEKLKNLFSISTTPGGDDPKNSNVTPQLNDFSTTLETLGPVFEELNPKLETFQTNVEAVKDTLCDSLKQIDDCLRAAPDKDAPVTRGIYAGAANDNDGGISGRIGDDFLFGGAGADVLNGGVGGTGGTGSTGGGFFDGLYTVWQDPKGRRHGRC